MKIKRFLTLNQNHNLVWPTLLFISMFVCKNFFHFHGNFSMVWKFFVRAYSEYQPHCFWTHVPVAPCAVSRVSYPLVHNAITSRSVYKHIYLRWNNAINKKNTKRLIILMLLTSNMYKNFFILCLISSHSMLLEIF